MSKDKVQIDENVKEILDNIDKNSNLTSDEKNKRILEIKESLEFKKAIENIDISNNDNRVIFTDGNDQLVYENGEFFVVSSTDSLKLKKKKSRKEARDLYIEYFIKYQLNPILKQKQIDKMTKIIVGEEPELKREKDKVKNTLKEKVKKVADKKEVKKVKEKTKSNNEKIR